TRRRGVEILRTVPCILAQIPTNGQNRKPARGGTPARRPLISTTRPLWGQQEIASRCRFCERFARFHDINAEYLHGLVAARLGVVNRAFRDLVGIAALQLLRELTLL